MLEEKPSPANTTKPGIGHAGNVLNYGRDLFFGAATTTLIFALNTKALVGVGKRHDDVDMPFGSPEPSRHTHLAANREAESLADVRDRTLKCRATCYCVTSARHEVKSIPVVVARW